MATTHILAVGRIQGGVMDMVIAPRRQQPVCSDTHGCHCYAYSHGYDDAKAGYLPEPLYHVSALCCVNRYMAGHRDGLLAVEQSRPCRTSGGPGAMPTPHGTLQAVIDYGAELEEQIEGRLDEEFWASGAW